MSYGNPQVQSAQGSDVYPTPQGPAGPPSQNVWLGDFSTGDLSQYALLQSQNATKVGGIWQDPSRVTVHTSGGPSWCPSWVALTCLNADLGPNPRCQLVSPVVLVAGKTYDLYWGTMMTYVPTWSGSNFFLLTEIYESPFSIPPPVSIQIRGGNLGDSNIGIPDSNGNWLWTSAWPINTWMYFKMRMYMAQDNTGWIQLRFASDGSANGAIQNFSNGQNKIFTPTIIPGGANASVYPDLYRGIGLEASSSSNHTYVRVDNANGAF